MKQQVALFSFRQEYFPQDFQRQHFFLRPPQPTSWLYLRKQMEVLDGMVLCCDPLLLKLFVRSVHDRLLHAHLLLFVMVQEACLEYPSIVLKPGLPRWIRSLQPMCFFEPLVDSQTLIVSLSAPAFLNLLQHVLSSVFVQRLVLLELVVRHCRE